MLKIRLLLTLALLWSLPTAVSAGPQSPSCLMRQLDLLSNLKTGHIGKNLSKVEDKIAIVNKELEGLNHEGVIPWSPRKRDAVKRFMVEKFGVDSWAQKLPEFDPKQKLGKAIVKIDDIRFSQVNARNMSQDGKYTVIDNAKAFKNGTLTVDKLPPVRVWRDTEGRIWTLDHRRLAAMQLSGVIDDVPVEFVDNATVQAQKFKFGTRNEGKSIFVWLDNNKADDLSIVITQEKLPTSPLSLSTKPATESRVAPLYAPNLPTGHMPNNSGNYLSLLAKKENELSHLNHQGVITWGPRSRDAAKRFMIEKFNMTFLSSDIMPTYDKAQKLGKAEVQVKDIRFSQIRCRNSSQDGKYSVLGNAKSIQAGTLKVTDLPTIRVWRDTQGRIWTLDHRRLAAIRLSGKIDKIQVEFVDQATVQAQRFKFDTLNEGQSMFVWLDDAKEATDLSVVISNENKVMRANAGMKAGNK